MKHLKKTLPGLLPDLVLALGGGMVAAGFGLIWLPVGLIVGGGILMAAAILIGGDES